MIVWQRDFKRVVKQRARLEVSTVFMREGEQYDIEPSCAQLFDEARRQVFDQIKSQGGIGATQRGQNFGQQEWANSRDYPHPEGPAERLAPGTRGLEMRSRVGHRMPLASTGIGKAMMLDLGPDSWHTLFEASRRALDETVPRGV